MEKCVWERNRFEVFILIGLIWLLAFQSPLESVWGPFSYLDECVALLGVFAGAYELVIRRKCRPSKEMLWIGIPMLAFVAVGLAGNIIYRYQPLKCVVIDLYTNLKFFFAIGTGYYLFRRSSWNTLKKAANLHAKIVVSLLFCVFLADAVFDFFPGGIRYGLKSAQLFYHHPTYLAGAAAFLLVLLTMFFEKGNTWFSIMTLVIMAFTLRAKAIACVVMYIVLFLFFVVYKRTLKWWYVLLAGLLCVAIGWPKIHFYFVELADHSARSVVLLTSFMIMKDYFPIGTGFGTYASAEAAKHYSPVYLKYGFNDNFELRDVNNVENSIRLIQEKAWMTQQYQKNPEYVNTAPFLNDHFWPIIFGQTGILGTLMFLVMAYRMVKRSLALRKYNLYAYVGILFAMVYLLVSSIAEPAFHNAIAIPLAVLAGIAFYKEKESATE